LAVISVDEDMNESSTLLLKEGIGYVDILEDNIERWGDYITLSNRFNSNTCWLFGCIGGSNAKHDNYLFELSLDKSASTNEITQNINIEAFPNPVTEYVNLAFELDKRQTVSIAIYNQNGQLLETLVHDAFNEGKHQLNFEMSQLAAGIYFLKIEGNNGLLAHKQIVK